MKKGTVWIIGGSSGLGLATAEAFAADDWFVVSGARSFKKTKQENAIRELHLDVTDEESRAAFVKSAFVLSPRVDVLVYCAAILILSPCELTSNDEYFRVMQTNFLGMTAFVSLVMPKMRKQGKREDRVVFLYQRPARYSVPKRVRGLQARRGRLCGVPGDGVREYGSSGIAD